MGNIIYQERLRCRRVRKIRGEDQDEDKGDLNYVSERDLEEEELDFGILLGTVINWQPFTNPHGIFTEDHGPITDVETLSCDLYLLISFDKFDKIMVDFIDKQNRYAGNTEELISQ